MKLECVTDEQESDLRQLISCIDIVDDFILHARQAGSALSEIQEYKLYKHWFPTFSEFTKNQWNMSADVARNLMSFSRVCKVLEDKGEVKLLNLATPTNTQPIPKKMSDEDIVKTFTKASDNKQSVKVTKTEVKQAINKEKISKNINKNIIDIFSDIDIDKAEQLVWLVDDIAGKILWWVEEEDRIATNDKAVQHFLSYDKALDKALAYMKLDKEVGRDELKRVYKQMSKQLHPDKGGDTEQFQELQDNLKVIEDYIDGNKRLRSKITDLRK